MRNHDSRDVAADQDTTGRTVVGMFTNRPDAEAAIRELKAAGFGDDRIGVALQDQEDQRDVRDLLEATGREAAGGAAKGAVSGSLVGGLIGLLGSLLIPGVGPIVVGGVLASTLTGAGIGAATGGIIGALVALGVPEADARHFDEGLRSGRTLVTVDAGARTAEALMVLDRHGMDFGPSGASRYERGRYPGKERRTTQDPTYAGPERRLVGV
jgi:heat induced stress protein YflT